MVEEQEGRERPQDVEGEQGRPHLPEFLADAGRVEEDGAEEKGADRDEHRGGDDEDGENGGGVGQRREEILNFGEVGESADIEAEIHELEKDEESLGDGVGDFGELVECGEDGERGGGAGFSGDESGRAEQG